MLFTDLREAKAMFDIEPGDGSEDKIIGFIIETASSWIEELVDRPDMSYRLRTEYYNGTGTPKLPLRHRPVYATPTPEVYLDESAWFGSVSGSFASDTQLTYGNSERGFSLQVREEGQPSRSGILYRNNDVWPKFQVRSAGVLTPYVAPSPGIIKVVYYGGWTLDTLPAAFRLACQLLVARLLYVFPLGVELNSEGFEERSVGVVTSEKSKLLALVNPIIWNYRNWSW